MPLPAHKRDYKAETERRMRPLVEASATEIQQQADQLLEAAAKRGGRPSTYNDEIAAEIVGRVAEGETVAEICRSDDRMPAAMTVYWWTKRYPRFGMALDRARFWQGESWGQTAVSEVMRDVYEGENPDDRDAHARAKARAMMARTRGDVLLRAAGRRCPDRWGDRSTPGAGVQITINTNLQPPPEQSSGAYVVTAEEDEPKP